MKSFASTNIAVLPRVGKQIMVNSNWRNKMDRLPAQNNLRFGQISYCFVS